MLLPLPGGMKIASRSNSPRDKRSNRDQQTMMRGGLETTEPAPGGKTPTDVPAAL